MIQSPALRAAIYARYSSDNQREASLEDQIRICRRLIAQKDWTIAEVYTDAAISGASALRPGYIEMPADIRHELDRLVTITEADVTEGLIRREAHQEGLRAEYGASRVIGLPLTRESVKQGLIFIRIHDLDWLFFSNWRWPDGWLPPSERKRTMEIFHDSLAIRMRRAVVRRLYPDRPEFSG